VVRETEALLPEENKSELKAFKGFMNVIAAPPISDVLRKSLLL
jgi:hypothetical protein